MISNEFKLSFSIGVDTPNSRLNQDMIVLSYSIFLSCALNGL